MKKVSVQIAIHIAAWACFLLLPLVFSPRPRGERELNIFTDYYFTPFFIVNIGIIIAFYYLNTYVFIPKLLDTKKFVAYGLLILGLLIFYGVVPRIYHGLFGSLQPLPAGIAAAPRPPRPRNFPLLSPGNIAIFLLVFVFSTGINVINQWLRSERKTKEIEKTLGYKGFDEVVHRDNLVVL